jgi:hypothetical protein
MRTPLGTHSRNSSVSPADGKATAEAAGLTARMGGLVLTEKEAMGFVFKESEQEQARPPKWSAIGKAFSPRPMNKRALEMSMPRAWGLHREAQFKIIGRNLFSVTFGSEGDWRHALNNGPWQFDFNVLVLKDYDGATRPSEMTFETVDVWIRVDDLPLDKRSKVFGEALGNWLGKIVRVDVEKDGFAKGSELRFRAKLSVFEPLVRGFYLKKDEDDLEKTWFDFKYEKIPHFCFECGRLVHGEGGCTPAVEPDQQWGEWLRASPGRSSGPKEGSHRMQSGSANSYGSVRSSDGDKNGRKSGTVRDLPTKRNLQSEFTTPAASHTGGGGGGEYGDVSSPNKQRKGADASRERDLRDDLEQKRERIMRSELRQRQQEKQAELRNKYKQHGPRYQDGAGSSSHFREGGRRQGYYVRKPRPGHYTEQRSTLSPGHEFKGERKRWPKQYWVPKGDLDRQVSNDIFIRDTRQKTSSVFDRISEQHDEAADPARQGRRTP